ncbi:Cullin binding-domain-containing protein [Schizothecium vesticola]|uniref:Defective in cullin neddylation protein n=1 Tax=Schizothecium vesticola TaxID=314040 RepID=A0AA40F824_9PEZI|nr:Cullin binding-domain-containing protein [Schizothecium vesticola]
MAAAATTVEPEESRVMFSRWFTSCFQARQERSALSSQKDSLHPAEGFSETESGASTFHLQHSPPRQQAPPQSQPHLRTAPGPSKPQPALRTKDPDMPKVPRKSKTPAARLGLTARPKKKSVFGSEMNLLLCLCRCCPHRSLTPSLDRYLNAGEPDDSAVQVEATLNDLFESLLNDQDIATDAKKQTMGAESLMAYIASLGANHTNYECFVVLDTVQADCLGQISRKGFVDGWKELALGRDRVQPTISSQKQYVRKCIEQVPRDAAYFKNLYQRAFLTGKEPAQRAVERDVAIAFWDMLFDPQIHPWRSAHVEWLTEWKDFLEAKWKRSVNRDMWSQTLLFATKTMEDETLGFWSEDQAWPGVIDDFVMWCREKGIAPEEKAKKDGGNGMEVDR